MANSNSSSNSNLTSKPTTTTTASLHEKNHLRTPTNSTTASSSSAASPTTRDAPRVRTLSIKDYKAAGACLADSFATDSVVRYFIDVPDTKMNEDEKWALHVRSLEYIVAAHCYGGRVTAVEDGEGGFGAVALWMPPGRNMDTLYILFRSGLWRLWFAYTREARTRFYSEFLPLLHHTKCEVLGKERDSNSMYLVYIGTRAGCQGKGFGTALIKESLDFADKANIPTYLESSADVNEPYYAKFGFVFEKAIWLQRGEQPIRLGIMVREPKTGSKKASEKEKGKEEDVRQIK